MMMKLDQDTKFIARLHTKPNARGLNIYNPFFEDSGINAAYLLFFDKDPKSLLEGIKKLNFVGANTAGFETDPNFASYINDFDVSSEFIKRVGYIKNVNGKFIAYYQGGIGLLSAMQEKFKLEDKVICIVGAGNVASSLLFTMQNIGIKPKKVTLFNRTIEKALVLKNKLNIIDDVKPLTDLKRCSGDILINATNIGGNQPDELYTEEIISKFNGIVDVTFEKEDTNLIILAKQNSKEYSTGWDFFTYQGKVMLEDILGIVIDPKILKKYVEKGLKSVV